MPNASLLKPSIACERATISIPDTREGAPAFQNSSPMVVCVNPLRLLFLAGEINPAADLNLGLIFTMYLLLFDASTTPTQGQLALLTLGPMVGGGPAPNFGPTFFFSEPAVEASTDHASDGQAKTIGFPFDRGLCVALSRTPRVLTIPQSGGGPIADAYHVTARVQL